MRLPNGDQAIVDRRKLRDYCLNMSHPEGRHKARVFRSALGLTRDDTDALAEAFLEAARTVDAVQARADQYGQRYQLDFVMTWQGKRATVRTAWIILQGTQQPRLSSCFVLIGRQNP